MTLVLDKVRNARHAALVESRGYAPNVLVLSHEDLCNLVEDLKVVQPYNCAGELREFMGMQILRSEDAKEPRVLIDICPPK